MTDAVGELLRTLDLERLEENLFRGLSPQVGWQRVFGGQVVGQAIIAARRTVDSDRRIHSLHGYFMRPGDPAAPIVYSVDRIRDGGSFTTRRVVATQHGHAIFTLAASFHVAESGLDHQFAMPEVPSPESLPSEAELAEKLMHVAPENVRRYWRRKRAIELRPVDLTHYFSAEKLDPFQHVWFRASAPLPDDPSIHEAVLGYASDMTLLDTSLFAHGRAVFDPTIQVASLDHALWFHRPSRLEEWHLYAQDSPSSAGARGFTRGGIFARDGKLIASVAQEGLIRIRRGTSVIA